MAASKRKNEFFDGIMTGTKEIIQSLRGEKQLTARHVSLPKPAKPLTAKQIVKLRQDKLKVSQTVFAGLLNVTPGTVRSWEQGVNHPSGATLRLLQITWQKPEILLSCL